MLKTIVKSAGAGLLYHTGYFDRIARPPLTVLGYHRVVEDPVERVTTSPPGMSVTKQMFERQLAYAARRYKLVTLGEIEAASEGKKPLPDRAAFVTFDDGWEDNYSVAYPVMKRMGVPAAIFVTTDYIGSKRVFWFTSLMHHVLTGGVKPGEGRAAGWPEDVATELDRVAALNGSMRPGHLDALVEMLKKYPETQIDTMVDGLLAKKNGAAKATKGNGASSLFLTWDQLREMEKANIGVASHTATHKILTQLTDAAVFDELKGSRDTLERELKHPVQSFAFPNGDYAPRHMELAWEAGYRTFFVSTRIHPGGPAGRVFPRPCVHERVGLSANGGFSPSLFELHLVGLLDKARGRTSAY